jgi:hypothetical protein
MSENDDFCASEWLGVTLSDEVLGSQIVSKAVNRHQHDLHWTIILSTLLRARDIVCTVKGIALPREFLKHPFIYAIHISI